MTTDVGAVAAVSGFDPGVRGERTEYCDGGGRFLFCFQDRCFRGFSNDDSAYLISLSTY